MTVPAAAAEVSRRLSRCHRGTIVTRSSLNPPPPSLPLEAVPPSRQQRLFRLSHQPPQGPLHGSTSPLLPPKRPPSRPLRPLLPPPLLPLRLLCLLRASRPLSDPLSARLPPRHPRPVPPAHGLLPVMPRGQRRSLAALLLLPLLRGPLQPRMGGLPYLSSHARRQGGGVNNRPPRPHSPPSRQRPRPCLLPNSRSLPASKLPR